jgi:hypothetical protein
MRRIGGVNVYLYALLTSALDGGEWSSSRPGHFTPRERAPLHMRLDGPQSRSGRGGEEKNSQPLPGLEPSIIQPLSPALCHWAIPARGDTAMQILNLCIRQT